LLGIEPLKVVDNIEEILTLGPGTNHPIRLNTLTATEEDKLVPFNQAAVDRKAKKTAIAAPVVAPPLSDDELNKEVERLWQVYYDETVADGDLSKDDAPSYKDMEIDLADEGLIDDISIEYATSPTTPRDFKEKLLKHFKESLRTGSGKPKIIGKGKPSYTPKLKAYKKKIIKYY